MADKFDICFQSNGNFFSPKYLHRVSQNWNARQDFASKCFRFFFFRIKTLSFHEIETIDCEAGLVLYFHKLSSHRRPSDSFGKFPVSTLGETHSSLEHTLVETHSLKWNKHLKVKHTPQRETHSKVKHTSLLIKQNFGWNILPVDQWNTLLFDIDNTTLLFVVTGHWNVIGIWSSPLSS